MDNSTNKIYFYLENWKSLPDVYNKIEEYLEYNDISSTNIINNISPLCYALQCRCEYKIIELLYKYSIKYIDTIHIYNGFNNNDNIVITYRDCLKWRLCLLFKHIFIKQNIKDHLIYDIDFISKDYEYLTKCLSIMNLKETDINWELPIINGYYN